MARAVGVRADHRACCRPSGSSAGAGGCDEFGIRNSEFGIRAALRRGCGRALLLVLTIASRAAGGERYALIITGASGGDAYAQKYDEVARRRSSRRCASKFHYDPQRLIVLAEPRRATGVQNGDARERPRGARPICASAMTKDDQLLVLLIGHGTSLDGDEAKFNLVGPDLSAAEWSDLLRPTARARSCSSTRPAPAFRSCASSPAKGHVVLTATDAAAQQFETVFPEFFIKAFDDPAADLDRERPRVDLGGVHLRQRRRAAVVRAERAAADRAAAARRHRRRRRPRGAEPRHRRRDRARHLSRSRMRRWRCPPTPRSPA